jgi:GH35 family endo-1,4-beta-xylanase
MHNLNFSRRAFLAASGVLLSTRMKATPRQERSSLKEVYKNHFLIGTALDFRRPDEFNSAELEILTNHFNVLTPENSMKPGPVHPQGKMKRWDVVNEAINDVGDNTTAATENLRQTQWFKVVGPDYLLHAFNSRAKPTPMSRCTTTTTISKAVPSTRVHSCFSDA